MFESCFSMVEDAEFKEQQTDKSLGKDCSIRKRPLAEIGNLLKETESNRKKASIEFDMARIDRSEYENPQDETHIPLPPRVQSNQQFKIVSARDKTSSNIPSPPGKNKLNINMQHINKLIDMKDNLSRRSREPTLLPPGESALRTRLSNLGSNLKEDQFKQEQIEGELESQIRNLVEKMDSLEHEVVDIKRSLKKVKHRLSEVRLRINSQKKRFEFAEDSVMKNVAHKEKLINVQIKELENQLENQYKEITFQLQDELLAARSYEDHDILNDIEKLDITYLELEKKLEETKQRKRQSLKEEVQELDDQLEKYLSSKVEHVEKLTQIYQEKQSGLENISNNLNKLEIEIGEKNEYNSSIVDSANAIESDMNSFSEIKHSLSSNLEKEEKRLLELETKSKEWDTKYKDTLIAYNNAKKKFDKIDNQRKTIEDSIMNYEKKARIYVKLPEEVVSENGCFEYRSKNYSVNKCFGNFSSNYEIIDEYRIMVTSSLMGYNSSVILCGGENKEFVSQAITSCFDSMLEREKKYKQTGWRFSYYFKQISVADVSTDMLNSLSPVNMERFQDNLDQIISQKMTLENSSSLLYVINESQPPNQKQCQSIAYVINIEARNDGQQRFHQSNVMFLNVSSLDSDYQREIIKNSLTQSDTNNESKVMNYAVTRSKCLYLAFLDSLPLQEIEKMLDTIEFIQSNT